MTRLTIFLLLAATVLVISGVAAIRTEPPAREFDAIARPAAAGSAGSASSPRAISLKAGSPKAGSPRTSSGQAPRLLPDKYRVLLDRCIFARDGRASAQAPDAVAGAHRGGLWVGPPGTEATLAFRGVTLTDGNYSAYIEDMTGGGVRRFSRGEEIAAGRIAGISLNGMDYQAGLKVTRIALGQNLAGGDAPPPTPPTTAPASPPTPPEDNPRGPWHGRPPGPPPGGSAQLDLGPTPPQGPGQAPADPR